MTWTWIDVGQNRTSNAPTGRLGLGLDGIEAGAWSEAHRRRSWSCRRLWQISWRRSSIRGVGRCHRSLLSHTLPQKLTGVERLSATSDPLPSPAIHKRVTVEGSRNGILARSSHPQSPQNVRQVFAAS